MSLQFPEIDPVALSIGPLQIRWYALAYLAGILLGWLYALHLVRLDKNESSPSSSDGGKGNARKPLKSITKTDIDDFIVWAVAGIILGGRLGYVLFYQFDMYLQNPLQIFKIWQGGMSFHGGALGVIIAMILFSWKRHLPLLRLTDIICAVVPIGLFFGRIANFINGELYGRVTDVSWGIVFPHGGPAPRHPSQLYQAGLEGLVLGLILCALIHMKSIRRRPGIVSGVFLIGYASARAFAELFRQPDYHIGFIMDHFTMGQILSVPMAIGGLYLIVRAVRRSGTTQGQGA